MEYSEDVVNALADKLDQCADDMKFLVSLLPAWAMATSRGLDPTMYGTGTYGGDLKVVLRVKKINEFIEVSEKERQEKRVIQIWMVVGKDNSKNPVEGKVYEDKETAHVHCDTLNRIFGAGNCEGGPFTVYTAQIEVGEEDPKGP
jgi:hypothetical protein